jgi:hypothetical protein
MASSRGRRNDPVGDVSPSTTGRRAASMRAAAATFDIHMDNTAVASPTSMTSRTGRPRESRSASAATARSAPCALAAAASANPPRKSANTGSTDHPSTRIGSNAGPDAPSSRGVAIQSSRVGTHTGTSSPSQSTTHTAAMMPARSATPQSNSRATVPAATPETMTITPGMRARSAMREAANLVMRYASRSGPRHPRRTARASGRDGHLEHALALIGEEVIRLDDPV